MSYDALKTPEEFKAYIEAQKKALIDASKKIKELEDLNKELQQQVTDLSSEIAWDAKKDQYDPNIGNSEMICLVEIEKLKHLTATRPLTLEESKKFSTYYDILTNLHQNKMNKEDPYKDIPSEELLKLVKNEE